MTEPWAETTDETVALLLEEVARLEAELQARDSAVRGFEPSREDHAENRDQDRALERQVAELTAELAGRDETISALLEQSDLFENTAAAQRAEWEQLHQWVDELEQRIEGKDDREAALQADLAAALRNHQSECTAFEAELRVWEARHRALGHEADGLRKVIRHDGPGGEGDEGVVEFLRRENRELRETSARLEHEASAAAEVGPLTERLNAAVAELDAVKARLAGVLDESEREKNEYEATVASLKTRLAAGSLTGAAERQGPALTEADERIRAFRDHLRELHKAEAARLADRKLSSRLSRLWRSTGPG